MWHSEFARFCKEDKESDEVGTKIITPRAIRVKPRYRITSHVQGLKGGAVLNGTMAVELLRRGCMLVPP